MSIFSIEVTTRYPMGVVWKLQSKISASNFVVSLSGPCVDGSGDGFFFPLICRHVVRGSRVTDDDSPAELRLMQFEASTIACDAMTPLNATCFWNRGGRIPAVVLLPLGLVSAHRKRCDASLRHQSTSQLPLRKPQSKAFD